MAYPRVGRGSEFCVVARRSEVVVYLNRAAIKTLTRWLFQLESQDVVEIR
ncbi:MAG: hypothetical protein H6Q86_5904 [candidate division NC10 bacterium]|nr:hypothetical protein [candidate division NC10 bacterium]